MNEYFITTDDIKNGRKVLLGARIVTPIGMRGKEVKLAEDGKWHLHTSLSPLTEEQIREEEVEALAALVKGRQISTMKAKGRGVEFVLDDNTRVALTLTSGDLMELSVIDSDGQRIL